MRWERRSRKVAVGAIRRGRPEVIPPEARWKIRRCYQDHFGQWGPSVLRYWAIRERIGTWSTGTIARVIADLAPTPEEIPKLKKYEIASPMAMWSEDGTYFKERGRKKELLVLQDECSRYKINRRLAVGPADSSDVADYLKEAFDRHGAPLVLKHDGGSIFHDEKVKDLLKKHDVVELTSPPYYPPFNGKKERSMRDIKSYERALRKHGKGVSLFERIDITMCDLNDERPRPVLGGRTAKEVFERNRCSLPNRKRFKMEVETRQVELEARAGSRKEIQAARRKAVIEVLMRYNLLNWRGDVSTNYQRQVRTN
jgi:transposase InsO family protein